MAADLLSRVRLAQSRGSLLRQQTEAARIASGVHHMHIVCEAVSNRSALETVADTDLITSMPMDTVKSCLQGKFTFLPFDHPEFRRPLGAAVRSNSSANPAFANKCRPWQGPSECICTGWHSAAG